MSLNALLTAMKEDFASKADPAVLTIMMAARQQILDMGVHEQALGPGEIMPDFVLRDFNGKEFSSREVREKGPLLLSWYRGIW